MKRFKRWGLLRNKLWFPYFYVVLVRGLTLNLWYVKDRDGKRNLAGGFGSRSQAVLYLDKNWQRMLMEKIEDTLLR
jgi:hypothetical protein